jgi:hypothetical protein
MPTVRSPRPQSHAHEPFTDLRAVVIVLMAFILAVCTGLGASALTIAAGASVALSVAAALGSGGTAMVVMVAALHDLIAKR